MSLWVDKYRPTTLAKLDYHLEQAEDLKNMVIYHSNILQLENERLTGFKNASNGAMTLDFFLKIK